MGIVAKSTLVFLVGKRMLISSRPNSDWLEARYQPCFDCSRIKTYFFSKFHEVVASKHSLVNASFANCNRASRHLDGFKRVLDRCRH